MIGYPCARDGSNRRLVMASIEQAWFDGVVCEEGGRLIGPVPQNPPVVGDVSGPNSRGYDIRLTSMVSPEAPSRRRANLHAVFRQSASADSCKLLHRRLRSPVETSVVLAWSLRVQDAVLKVSNGNRGIGRGCPTWKRCLLSP